MGRVIFFLLALVIIAAAILLSNPDPTAHWPTFPTATRTLYRGS